MIYTNEISEAYSQENPFMLVHLISRLIRAEKHGDRITRVEDIMKDTIQKLQRY